MIPPHQITNIPLCNVITVNHQISHRYFRLMLWVWLVNLVLMAATSITLYWWLPIGVSINVVDHQTNAMLIFSWIATFTYKYSWWVLQCYIDRVVQDCGISNALAMEILQSCPKRSTWSFKWAYAIHRKWLAQSRSVQYTVLQTMTNII